MIRICKQFASKQFWYCASQCRSVSTVVSLGNCNPSVYDPANVLLQNNNGICSQIFEGTGSKVTFCSRRGEYVIFQGGIGIDVLECISSNFRQSSRFEKLSSCVDWERQSLYSLAKDSFLWLDVFSQVLLNHQQKDKLSSLISSCCLSFYAALFADRHGTILSLDPQSTVSAMILSLYSGFNRLIPHDESDRLVQTNALLNAVEHHVLPASSESLSSLQTVVLHCFLTSCKDLFCRAESCIASLSHGRPHFCLSDRERFPIGNSLSDD